MEGTDVFGFTVFLADPYEEMRVQAIYLVVLSVAQVLMNLVCALKRHALNNFTN